MQFLSRRAAILYRRHIQGLQVLCTVPHVACVHFPNHYIVAAYASPNQDVDGWFEDLEDFINTLSGLLSVVGDFDCRLALYPG